MTYRVLVTGSRTWPDADLIEIVLRDLLWAHPDLEVVHGACPRGADRIADQWCIDRNVRVVRWPANWDRLGRRAGFARNLQMVRSDPAECVAFIKDRSTGATHCADQAELRGIPTRRWRL